MKKVIVLGMMLGIAMVVISSVAEGFEGLNDLKFSDALSEYEMFAHARCGNCYPMDNGCCMATCFSRYGNLYSVECCVKEKSGEKFCN